MGNQDHPEFSIIIPVYKTEQYLRQCIDSVIVQTWQDFEIICINDESPDNSLEILQEYATENPSVTVIDQRNQGVSASRNRALKIARGKYVLFLDSDDWLSPNTLELLREKAEAHHADMVMFASQLFYEGSDKTEPFDYTDFASFLPDQYLSSSFSWRDLIGTPSILWRLPVSACTTAYRLDFLKEHKLHFPEGLRYEDNLFFHQALAFASHIVIETSLLYCRRKHGESMMAACSDYFRDLCQIRLLENDFFKQFGNSELHRSFLLDFSLKNLEWCYRSLPPGKKECFYTNFRRTLLDLIDSQQLNSHWNAWSSILTSNPIFLTIKLYKIILNILRSCVSKTKKNLIKEQKAIIKSTLLSKNN